MRIAATDVALATREPTIPARARSNHDIHAIIYRFDRHSSNADVNRNLAA